MAILPIVLSASEADGPRGRWDNAIAAVGCGGVAIVALRLRATWAS